jgi:hypothetical protein
MGGTSSFDLSSARAFTSFGFYITGLGDEPGAGTLHVRFHDTQDEDKVVTGSPLGGAVYVAYVGTGAPITDLQLVQTGVTGPNRDVFSIDDVRLVAAVPEPSGLVLTGIGLGAWLARRALRSRPRRA